MFRRVLIKVVVLLCLFSFFAGCKPDDGPPPPPVIQGLLNNAPALDNVTLLIRVAVNEVFTASAGTATDPDEEKKEDDAPGHLTCAAENNTCSFDVIVTGEGNGNVSCDMTFTAGPDIEVCDVDVVVTDGQGVSVGATVRIEVGEQVDISNCVPNPVDEGASVSCDVAAVGGTPEVDPGADGCGGAVTDLGSYAYTYDFTSTEAQGPGNCDAAIQLTENNSVKDFESVAINEVNEPPVNNAPATAGGDELTLITFDMAPTDPDIPAQAFICTIATNTCPGGALNGCVFEWTPTEDQGPNAGCDVTTRVSDGLLNDDVVTTVTVNEVNVAPDFAELPTAVACTTGAACGLTVTKTDVDDPQQPLTCSVVANTCAWGAFADTPGVSGSTCAYTGTATTSGTCTVTLSVSDGVTSTNEDLTFNVNDCVVDLACPSNPQDVNETATLNCPVTYAAGCTAGSLVENTSDDTCPNVVVTDNSNGTGSYEINPAPGEAAGPGSCLAAVSISSPAGAQTDQNNVNINEVNNAPTVTVNCTSPANENAATTCALTAADVDLPSTLATDPGYFTCSINAATTCTGVTLNGCASVDVAAQGEAAGPGSCDVVVDITDGYSATGQGTDTITIDEVNTSPTITVNCVSPADENAVTSCSLTAADTDLPATLATDPGSYTCSINAATTCTGVTLNGCASVDVAAQGEAAGPGSCDVVVDIEDGYSATGQGFDTITINEVNVSPFGGLTCPSNVGENSTGTCSIAAGDTDLPNTLATDPGYVTCSIWGAQTTCTGVTITDCTQLDIAAQGEDTGGGDCRVGIQITDGYSEYLRTTSLLVIDEDNQVPTWTSAPTNIMVYEDAGYDDDNGVASDVDLPNTGSGPGYVSCSYSNNTCTFTPTVTGAGDGSATCHIAFTDNGEESCQMDIVVTDDGATPQSVSQTIAVDVLPKVVFVDVANNGFEDGTSWATAWNTIQEGVDDAEARGINIMWVAGGTYTSADTSILDQPSIDLEVYGGFTGGETFFSDRGDPHANPTVLDGQNVTRNVVYAIGSSYLLLDGLTIMRGNANSAPTYDQGGGIFTHYFSDLELVNCKVLDNYALSGGGGIRTLQPSSIVITDCLFSGNYSDNTGGAALFYQDDPVITGTVFEDNYTVYNGGAIWTSSNSFTMSDCEFYENYTTNLSGYGGAMHIETTATITNCTFAWNRSGRAGAIELMTTDSAVTITNCLFYANLSMYNGGAMNIDMSDANITNCTFTGNNAGVAGGAIEHNAGGTTNLRNSILYADIASSGREFSLSTGALGSTLNAYYNDIEGGCATIPTDAGSTRNCSTGNIDSDPIFVHVPYFWDMTTAAGTTITIEVDDATIYSSNDIIEIDNDGNGREVTSSSGTTVTFHQPGDALPGNSTAYMLVEDWGPGETDFVSNFHLGAGSPCINTGHPAASYTDPNGSRNDMGVYGGPGATP